jgi:YD repeat-containing protein
MKRIWFLFFVLCSSSAFAEDQFYYLIAGDTAEVQYTSPDAACHVLYNQLQAELASNADGDTVTPSPYTSPTLTINNPPFVVYQCYATATFKSPEGDPFSDTISGSITQIGDNCTDGTIYNSTSGQCEGPDDDQDHNEQGDIDNAQAAVGVLICPASKEAGDPINASTGNEYESETDYQDSDGELRFVRYYNSTTGYWTHSYNTQLTMSPNALQLFFDDGRSSLFKLNNGVATPQPSELGSLIQIGGQWVYTSPTNEQFTFDSTGRLVNRRQANGLAQTLAYTTNADYSSSVTLTDSRGRTLSWQNSNYGLLTQLTAGDLTVAYTWNITPSYAFQLTQVATTRANHAATRIYAYGDTRNPGWLTGITDERGIVYASWTYDAQGRATTSQHAGGADLTTVTYNSDGTSTVTNALGHSVTFTYQVIQGVNRVTHVAGQPTASCPASNSTFTYTPNGQVQTQTDALGHVTAYTYDTQGRLLTRVDAQGTPQERTTTTTWDTTWPYLPKTITTADNTTTYAYDDQGRLTSTTVHSTKG